MASSTNDSELIKVFKQEAKDLIAGMRTGLASLGGEGRPMNHDPQVVKELFRCAHTLKSSAGAMGFEQLVGLATGLCEIFRADKDGTRTIQQNDMALLAEGVEACQSCLAYQRVDGYQALLKRLEAAVK